MSNMNVEENRLRSFESWPENASLDSRHQLARNGFFATGNGLEVECHWCHQRMSDVTPYIEQLLERHRLLEPLCGFIINNANCGNVPLNRYAATGANSSTSLATSATCSVQQPVDLHIESNRLATFKNWPNPNISPQSLAKAGFFYLNRSDEVKCVWCQGVIAKWEKQDNAFEEHQRFFPDCPRVQLGPLIEMASDGIRDLGIQQISPPKKPKFSSLDARLRTYANWPIMEIQRPEALSQAGLYYQNVDDQVRCFHCNIGLRSWQKEDDPWFEHAKWYPQCQFVNLVKGTKYVKEVQDLTRAMAQQHPNSPICPTMSIEQAMSTSPVLQALEIGIDGGSIRNATQRQLLTSGRPYDTVEDLVKAVFGERDNDDAEAAAETQDNSTEGAGASIVREVSRIINSIFNSNDSGAVNMPASSSVTLASTEPVECQEDVTVMPAATITTQTAATSEFSPSGSISNIKNTEDECAYSSSAMATDKCLASAIQRQLSPDRQMSLEDENRKLKDARLCKVCLDDEVGVVFLPCGHLVTCVQCAPGINQCPMCRQDIKGFVRTFLS